PGLRAQILIYPGMCADFETTPSYHENRQDPFLSTDSMRFYRAAYLGDADLAAHPDAAPLHAAGLGSMPPAYILAAEHDPVRDDGVLYGERLRAAGVAAETRVVAGMIHGFLRARRHSAVADDEFSRLGRAVRHFLR
ncbi:alpha/beta hydrolase fold domain-containing protein, partial [Rhizobiaceae sp. 2RAB30]